MSKTLRITLANPPLDALEQRHLESRFHAAALGVLPPSTATALRYIFRTEPPGTTIEPFLASASLQALLSIKKKRDSTLGVLVALVRCVMSLRADIGVFLAAEGTPFSIDRTDVPLSLLAAKLREKTDAWYRVRPS